jgi:hypothetical protein
MVNCCQSYVARFALVVVIGGWAAPAGLRALVENVCLAMEQASAAPSDGDDSPAFSIPLLMDTGGRPLGGEHRYTLTFPSGQLPPVEASWSLTMYSLPDRRLVANPIDRHRIDSPMLPKLRRDADGGLTLYIQKSAPGGSKDANWLPASAGPFMLILRLDRPEPSVLDAAWESPGVVRVD